MFDMSLNILYVLILSVTLSSILNNISSIKITKKQISIFIAIISIVIYFLIFWYKGKNLLVPISTIIMCIYFSIIFKNIRYSIFISICTQIIIALSDAIIGVIFVFIFKFDYSQILKNKMLYFGGTISVLIISFFICKIINIFFDKLNYTNLKKMNVKDGLIRISSVTIILFFMYLFLIIFKNKSLENNNKILISNIFITIIFIVLLITIIYLHDKKIKRTLTQIHRQNEYIQLKEYTDMLENNAKDLRSFKHDYINILQILGSYIESENINELKDFYNNELMPESQKILANDMCFTLLKHIKINSLKGFIASKIITAQSKDIKINIQISDDIHELSIRLIDMCRIMGVIFDNAIEAAELCHNGFIEFLIIKEDNTTTFILKNSCIDSTPPVYKMYENNFSTKGPGRGIGLKSIREMIDLKYTNVFLNTSIDNSTFKQELSINN